MGLFDRGQNQQQKSLTEVVGGDPQEKHDLLHSTFMEFIDEGLTGSTLDSEELRNQLTNALSAIIWEGFYSNNLDMLRILQRISAAYTVGVDSTLTDEEWGQWMFDDAAAILQCRMELLEQGKLELERNLSFLAGTQIAVLEQSTKHESVMKAVLLAAKAHKDSPNQDP